MLWLPSAFGDRVNMNVYDTGRDLLSFGVIPTDDMFPETALVKLMWALGQTDRPARSRKASENQRCRRILAKNASARQASLKEEKKVGN